MLRALGVVGAVRSPTYTLLERYPIAGGEALHLDLYRLATAGELEFLGLDDAVDALLWMIEWPERGVGALPAFDQNIALAMAEIGRASSRERVGQYGWISGVAGHVKKKHKRQ